MDDEWSVVVVVVVMMMMMMMVMMVMVMMVMMIMGIRMLCDKARELTGLDRPRRIRAGAEGGRAEKKEREEGRKEGREEGRKGGKHGRHQQHPHPHSHPLPKTPSQARPIPLSNSAFGRPRQA